jgi:N-acetylmuramoyl-L-alanine amidase
MSISTTVSRGLRALVVLLIGLWLAGLSTAARSEAAENLVSLPDVARRFDIATAWKPAERKLSLLYENHRAEILIGSSRLMVDGELMTLSEIVTAADGTVKITRDDAAVLFSRLLEREVTEAEIAAADPLYPRLRYQSVETALIKNIRYISYPRFTRLIITIAGDHIPPTLQARCIEGARSLTVELPNSRFLQPIEPITVGDRIVESIEPVRTEDGTGLIVRTAVEGVTYELQHYTDPPRVVVDIQSSVPTLGTESLISPAAPTPIIKHTEAPKISPFTTVVIDPGHGGNDQGARGPGGLIEKEITLDIALKLQRLIEEEADITVVLTRTGDYSVSLKERTAIANRAKEGGPADLFISIHTNAHRSPKVDGFETFFISDAIDPDAEATAARENAVIGLEEGADNPVDPALTPILWDLQFTEFVTESSDFALRAQHELEERLNTRNRGVRQAQFIVLAGVAMPSVLVEVGFISNRVEEAKLKTSDYRNRCAEALAAAVAAAKQRHDMQLGQAAGR